VRPRAQLGDNEGAIADAARAIELEPKLANAWLNRGGARAHKGDIAGEIEDLTHLIELEPDYADAFFNRGVAHLQRKEPADARADLVRFLELAKPGHEKIERAKELLSKIP
jgi:tetratricopeptide (TPR) repeat protein